MYRVRSLYRLQGMRIQLPYLILTRQQLCLVNTLLTLPCRHLFLRCMTFVFCKLFLNHFSSFEEFHKIPTEFQHPTEKGSFGEFKVGALISAKEFFFAKAIHHHGPKKNSESAEDPENCPPLNFCQQPILKIKKLILTHFSSSTSTNNFLFCCSYGAQCGLLESCWFPLVPLKWYIRAQPYQAPSC